MHAQTESTTHLSRVLWTLVHQCRIVHHYVRYLCHLFPCSLSDHLFGCLTYCQSAADETKSKHLRIERTNERIRRWPERTEGGRRRSEGHRRTYHRWALTGRRVAGGGGTGGTTCASTSERRLQRGHSRWRRDEPGTKSLPHQNGRDERSRGRRLWFDIGVAARSRGASLAIRLRWHELFVFL